MSSQNSIALPFSTIFTLIDSHSQVGMGVIKCSSGGTNESPGSDVNCESGSGQICKKDNSSYHVGAFSSNEANNGALLWSFELVYKVSGSGLYSQFINYGDYVRIRNYHPDFTKNCTSDTTSSCIAYYITSPECGSDTNHPMYMSSSKNSNQIFKLTTQPSKQEIDGSPTPSGAQIAFEQRGTVSPWEGNFLYTNATNTSGWVMSLNSSESSLWTLAPTYGVCFLPSEWDQNMYYISGLEWGDENYGKLFVANDCSDIPSCSTSEYDSSPMEAEPSAAGARYIVPWAHNWTSCLSFVCPPDEVMNCPYFCKGNWNDQISNTYNQTMCCSGLLSSSNTCHPSYCPQNTGGIPNKNSAYGSGAVTCAEIMTEECTPENWSGENSSQAYLQQACDSFITQAPSSPAQTVAQAAVESFYAKGSGNDPTTDSLFVRKAIDLCNLFPGMCDETLTKTCKKYQWSDLDPEKWISSSRASFDPYGTNLIDTCGCFMEFDQYVCEDENGTPDSTCKSGSGRVSRTCNAVCGMPNAVKPFDSDTEEFEQCGGATCIIDQVTFDQVNSSSGGFSLTQACSESGQGPYICYLGNDINLEGSGYGNVEIQQNCDVCYIFDPNDTAQRPIQVDCAGGGHLTPPSPPDIPQIVGNAVSFGQNLKWYLLVAGIIVILAMVIVLFML